jgi:hypothetical protein
VLNEITPAHQIVWTLNTSGQTGRATKYPREFGAGLAAWKPAPSCQSPVAVSPNPFSEATAIGYSLGTRSHVSLRVYDVTGRLVRCLVEGEMDPGRHEVHVSGAGLATGDGVYFAQLMVRAGSRTSMESVRLTRIR